MGIHVVRKIRQGWLALVIVLLSQIGATVYQAANAAPSCDADGDGFVKNVRKCGGILDCNDSDFYVNPGASEICGNGIDDDCDSSIDELCGGGSDILICQDGPFAGNQCTSDFNCGMCISGLADGALCASNNDCPPNTGKGSNRGKCDQHACIIDAGVQYDVIVAVGDSITDGFGDSDCVQGQAKTTCSGYTPVLRDLLTAARGYAHTIHDEGYGGATSYNGLYGNSAKDRSIDDDRPRPSIDDLITENPDADQYLVMFGTNDANRVLPVPSGFSLSKSHPDYPGTYKDNMEQIARKIILAGKEPVLAKAPYAKGDKVNLNTMIQQYNNVVDELVNDKYSIVVAPPDFYTWFENHQDQIWSEFMFDANATDNIHPKHTGYQAMADKWLYHLTH